MVEIGSGCAKVGYLDRPSGLRGTDEAGLWVGMIEGPGSQLLQIGLGQRTVERPGPVAVSVAQPQRAVTGLAKLRRIRKHGSKYRFQLAGRTRYDAQHLRGRCLPLQRFAEVVGALAQLVEQPRVLDGDDGLGREIL